MESLNIEKFNPKVAELQELVKATEAITVTDLTDKDKLEVVKEHRLKLRDARISITKAGKALREDALAYQKAVIAKEKELLAIVEPEEQRLKTIEDEAKKREIREKRKEDLPARKDKLASLGDDYKLEDDSLLDLDDKEFDIYYNKCLADKNEKDRMELEIEKAKLDRQKRDQEIAEQARQEERERLEREQAEKAERERIEREAKEKAEREAEQQKKMADRASELESAGLEFDIARQSYVLGDVRVRLAELSDLDDDAWKARVLEAVKEIEEAQEEEIKESGVTGYILGKATEAINPNDVVAMDHETGLIRLATENDMVIDVTPITRENFAKGK